MNHQPSAGRVVDAESAQSRLRRLSSWAQGLALLGILAVIAWALYIATDQSALIGLLRQFLSPEIWALTPSLSITRLAGSYLLSMVPVACFVGALWQARNLFGLLGRGRLFDPAVSRILVRLGGLVIAIAVAGIVCRSLAILVLTSANPVGHRVLAIGVGATDIGAVMAGLLCLAFALVMQEALQLHSENKGFV